MSGRLRRWLISRSLASATVLAVAVLGVTRALAGDGADHPSLIADSTAALFQLAGLRPGDAAQERCIAIAARGGATARVEVSGEVAGALAAALVMEMTVGQGPAPGDGHSCAGFVPERELWSGRLADFPTTAVPAVDVTSLASHGHRVYRFRAQLPVDAVAGAGQTATQTIAWRAQLEPDRGDGSQATTGCAEVPAERPREAFVIAGRRVTFLVGPVRLIGPGRPLYLRVKAPVGTVGSVSYRVGGRELRAGNDPPWEALVAVNELRRPRTEVVVTVVPVDGRPRRTTVVLSLARCPTLARAVAGGRQASLLLLRLDSTHGIRGASVTLPAGVELGLARGRVSVWGAGPDGVRRAVGTLDGSATVGSGLPSIRVRERRIELTGVPPGSGLVELALVVPAGVRPALAGARCRATIVTRLATDDGPVTVRHRLLGRGGVCP